MLKTLFRPRQSHSLAERLCAAIGARAREPVFYAALGVADTMDGRFDMVALHAWLVLDRLRALRMKQVSQQLVDMLFTSFDEGLRDLGAGDIGIGYRVRKMANAFYGRLAAYDAATTPRALREALARNIYRSGEADAAALADYVLAAQRCLARCDLHASEPDFGPPPLAA